MKDVQVKNEYSWVSLLTFLSIYLSIYQQNILSWEADIFVEGTLSMVS